MALNTATVWFDIHQLLGADFDAPRRTKCRVYTNVENGTLTDTSTGEIRMGDQAVTINADGTGEFTTWRPGAVANPASWQTYVQFYYPPNPPHGPGRDQPQTRTFGPYTIDDLTRFVTNKSLTSNVATLTFDDNHGLRVGDTMNVYNVDSTFNGDHVVITAVPSPTSVSYAKTAANVASVAATGQMGTACISLALLEDEQAIPPNYQTAFTESMEEIRDDAEAARDETEANINGLGIGTVTTGAAGSSAAVTLTGTAPDRDFNFTIPTGLQGLPGPGSAAWTASQAVVVGSVRQAPDGSWIKSNANRTTGATFDLTEQGFWTTVSTTDATLEQTALAASYPRRRNGLPAQAGALGRTRQKIAAIEAYKLSPNTIRAPRLRILTIGDSYAEKVMSGGVELLGTLAGPTVGAAITASQSASFQSAGGGLGVTSSTGTTADNTGHYDAWASGRTQTINAGGSRTYGSGGVPFTADRADVYYIVEDAANGLGGGTFKVQLDGVDVVGYTNVSAAGAGGSAPTMVPINLSGISLAGTHTLTLVGLTGKVRFAGLGADNTSLPGMVYASISQGGISLDDMMTTAARANLTTFISNWKPDLILFEMKEVSVYTPGSGLTYKQRVDQLFAAIAAAGTVTDVIGIGSPSVAYGGSGFNFQTDQVIQNEMLAAACKAAGYTYYDTYALFKATADSTPAQDYAYMSTLGAGSVTVSTTSGSATVTVTGIGAGFNMPGPGQTISGSGIQASSTISTVSGDTLTLDKTATATATGVTATIGGMNGDGTHVSAECDKYRATTMLRDLGVTGWRTNPQNSNGVDSSATTSFGLGRTPLSRVLRFLADTATDLDAYVYIKRFLSFRDQAGTEFAYLDRRNAQGNPSAVPRFTQIGPTFAGFVGAAVDRVAVRQGTGGSGMGAYADIQARGFVLTSPTAINYASGTLTFDLTTGSFFIVNVGANIATMAFTGGNAGEMVCIKFIQDATGSRTITARGGLAFAGGVAPTLSTAPGAVDMFWFILSSSKLVEVGRALNVS